jgi:nicotinamide-nucleotide amidase
MAEAPDTLVAALPDDVLARADEVLELARARKLTLATAESCTGGLLAALLTDVPGCSHLFERGFVTYSEEAKCEMLGVDRARLDRFGAVSKEIARDMAQGALNHSHADIAVSITGYAGPSGDDGEEGLVHFACVRRSGPILDREEHFGTLGRAGIRKAALETALEMMEKALRE